MDKFIFRLNERVASPSISVYERDFDAMREIKSLNRNTIFMLM